MENIEYFTSTCNVRTKALKCDDFCTNNIVNAVPNIKWHGVLLIYVVFYFTCGAGVA